MNLRPSGYEPDELPDCSTPHLKLVIIPGLVSERKPHFGPRVKGGARIRSNNRGEQMPVTAACARIPRLAVSRGPPL